MDASVTPEIFQDLFDNAPCGYLVVQDTRIVLANATLAGWLGLKASDLKDAPLREILSTAGRVLYETNLRPLLKLQGRIEEVSLDLRDRDGSRIPVLLAAIVQDNPSGETIIRMAFHKAAARRRYERELIHARKDLQRDLIQEQREGELREQFVAVLGHDLRNPLAAMSAATRLLAREPLTPTGTQVLTLMKGSLQRMSSLIDNVLDFARGRLGGGIGLTLEVDEPLEPLIRQVVDELRASVPGSNVQATVSALHPVRYDAGRIGQMVSNLLGNALTHGDLSHPVRIDAATTEGGGLVIWVSNRGTHIPADAMERLFHPFVRGGSNRYAHGLGLGLHIASEIAKAHGGTLTVMSTEEETRFTFEMPAVVL